ncbi:MAG: hypothetical protein GWN13_27615, partial [Phycisphaerae bacterium]|nr:hypothetical protein [Phycisphaerae bacterium]
MQAVSIRFPALLTTLLTLSRWIKTLVDNQPRFFLIIALALVVFLIWQAWIEEQRAKNTPPPGIQTAPTSSGDTPPAVTDMPPVGSVEAA